MDSLNPPEIPDEFAQYADEIRATVKKTVRFTLKPAVDLKPWQSNVGGDPYLPLTEEYPCNTKGVPLRFLVQINFSEMPHLPGYPEKGILEFYIDESDDQLGISYENPANQDGFRVLYFDTVEEDESKLFKDARSLLDEENYCGPLGKDSIFSIEFFLEKQYMTMHDYRFQDVISFAEDFEMADRYNDVFDPCSHRIGGYPYFAQYDPRGETESFAGHELLLQLDTDSIEGTEGILWGESGVGSFFILPDDLAECNFSKVLYYWDCI